MEGVCAALTGVRPAGELLLGDPLRHVLLPIQAARSVRGSADKRRTNYPDTSVKALPRLTALHPLLEFIHNLNLLPFLVRNPSPPPSKQKPARNHHSGTS